jgi:hypothetical protein
MDISNIPDQTWRDIIKGNVSFSFESLSFKILLSNLKLKVTISPHEESNCINELKAMINSQKNLPALQRDIQKIMGNGGSK